MATPVEVRKPTPTAVPTPDMWRSMRTEMERMFDRFGFGPAMMRRWLDLEPVFRPEMKMAMPAPAIDIAEDDKGFKLTAELPGMAEQDVEITVANDMLTLKGEKKLETETKEKNYTLSERNYGAFERAFWLPEGIDRDHIEANFAKGVLTVLLPKLPVAANTPTKVEVKAAA